MSEDSLKFPIDQIMDPEIKLQLISLQDKGSGALSEDKASYVRPLASELSYRFFKYVFNVSCLLHVFSQLSKVMSEMSTIYSTATVCLIDDPLNCQTLEPGTLC